VVFLFHLPATGLQPDARQCRRPVFLRDVARGEERFQLFPQDRDRG
jgi:hypothetical protein